MGGGGTTVGAPVTTTWGALVVICAVRLERLITKVVEPWNPGAATWDDVIVNGVWLGMG